ncbi:MAG: NUDIX domain-containing protein [Theionarchaea archaeon]|nr:NUDIX domain-containing protein [Theionarchaea archaeon]
MRKVVTAVLKKDKKILIVKRGHLVNTFIGKWSCISGRVEGSPLESVLREIKEETGIPEGKVTLLKEGNPVIARGENLEFEIYPFLFEVKDENIQLNWENTEYKWINPGKITQYRTVPKLKEVIEAVLD